MPTTNEQRVLWPAKDRMVCLSLLRQFKTQAQSLRDPFKIWDDAYEWRDLNLPIDKTFERIYECLREVGTYLEDDCDVKGFRIEGEPKTFPIESFSARFFRPFLQSGIFYVGHLFQASKIPQICFTVPLEKEREEIIEKNPADLAYFDKTILPSLFKKFKEYLMDECNRCIKIIQGTERFDEKEKLWTLIPKR